MTNAHTNTLCHTDEAAPRSERVRGTESPAGGWLAGWLARWPLGAALTGHVMMLAAVIVGSGVFIAIKVARAELGPVSLFLLRNDVAALCVLATWVVYRPRWRGWGWRLFGGLVLIALLRGPVYQILLNYGADGTSAGLMAMLVATIPLHAAWLSRLILGERLRWVQVFGVLVAFGGAILPIVTGERLYFSAPWPLLAIAGCALIGGLIVVGVRGMSIRLSSWDMVTVTILLAAVLCAPMHTPGVIAPWAALSGTVWAAVLFLAAAMFLHTLLMFAALRHLRAAVASSYQFVGMTLTSIWGFLLLDEPIGPALLAAVALITIGLVLNARSGRAETPAPAPPSHTVPRNTVSQGDPS